MSKCTKVLIRYLKGVEFHMTSILFSIILCIFQYFFKEKNVCK